MNLLKNFRKNCFDAFSNLITEVNNEIRSINWDAFEKEFNDGVETLNKEFSKWKMKVKEQAEKFYIEIPYDINTQILSYELRSNIITIKVKSDEDAEVQTEERTYERTIPSSFNGGTITTKYLKDSKTMVFICSKAMNTVSEDVTADSLSTSSPVFHTCLISGSLSNLLR